MKHPHKNERIYFPARTSLTGRPRAWLALCLAGFVLLFATAPVDAREVFRFRLETDDVLSIDKYQDILILKNGRVSTREEKNRIVLKVMKDSPREATLEGLFYTYFRTPRKVGIFRQDKDFFSRFTIAPSGRYTVPDQYVMPNLRDLPTFPDTPLSPGDEWSMPAQETMDFDFIKIKIPLKVFYRYTGKSPLLYPDKKNPGKQYDRFEYTYSFHRPVTHPASPVVRVHGFSSDQLWFDREQGIPIFDSNRLKYTFLLKDGSVVEYLYRIDSWWRKFKRTTDEEKIQIAKRLGKQLESNKSISVRPDRSGVILDLKDILFQSDSDKMTPAALRELDQVASILKQFPNREIRISGHTDSTGSASYNKDLSTRRAKSVGQALQKQHSVDGRRLSFQGYGETRPVAPNDTPEGRAKNRRVEILIVTE